MDVEKLPELYTFVDVTKCHRDLASWEHMGPLNSVEYGIDIVKNVICAELLSRHVKYEKIVHDRLCINTSRVVKASVYLQAGDLHLVPMTRSVGHRKIDSTKDLSSTYSDLGEIDLPFTDRERYKFHLISQCIIDTSSTSPWAVPYWLVGRIDGAAAQSSADNLEVNMVLKYESVEKTIVGAGANAVKVRFQIPVLVNTVELTPGTVLKSTFNAVRATPKAKAKARVR